MRRAGVLGKELCTPPSGESWSMEVAAEFAACLLNEIDDTMRGHIQEETRR